jgi:DNA topoisomerase-1
MPAKKSLVIVESPAKANTINKYLGKDFVVKASLGHVKDLPKSKLGVDIKNDFEPVYDVIPGKEKVIKELRTAAKSADRILLAADPGSRRRSDLPAFEGNPRRQQGRSVSCPLQ